MSDAVEPNITAPSVALVDATDVPETTPNPNAASAVECVAAAAEGSEAEDNEDAKDDEDAEVEAKEITQDPAAAQDAADSTGAGDAGSANKTTDVSEVANAMSSLVLASNQQPADDPEQAEEDMGDLEDLPPNEFLSLLPKCLLPRLAKLKSLN